MSKKPIGIAISKAPDDPVEKKKWADQMVRVQIAMWCDGKNRCGQCKKVYKSVDDFQARNPKCGGSLSGEFGFIDKECWDEFIKEHPQWNPL